MADSELPAIPINPTKKGKNSRRALKQKNTNLSSPSQESDVAVQKPLQAAVDEEAPPTKERISTQPKKGKSKGKSEQQKPASPSSFEKEMQEMQEMMEKLKIEKDRTEKMLKERDEMLRQKDEELESKERQQEKLQNELKKLQKLKEFKPTMSFPIVQALKDREQEKKEKKKGCSEKKRPSPPYILWCKDQWNEIKKENPGAEFKEISNILGAKWKNTTAEEKKPYEEKYQAEKDAYLQILAKEKREAEAMRLFEDEHKQKTAMELLEQYLQFKQDADKENKKKAKKERDPTKPKQPMSAFFLFSNERRATLLAENKNILEVAKVMGEEWKSMTEKQKRPYEEMAKKDKEKYLEEMNAYKQKKEEEAETSRKEKEEQMKLQKQEALQLLKKKEKTDNIIKKTKEQRQKKNGEKKSGDPNKPKKPASSFLLFSKETRKSLLEERPGINNSTLTALISVKWKELSEDEKAVWNGKAAEAMEVYKKEIEKYNKSLADDRIQQ